MNIKQNPDYSYLKPAIAAHMPAAASWFETTGQKQALQWALAIGFYWHDKNRKLLPDWQQALLEFRAQFLARITCDEVFQHNGQVITVRFSELWGHWQLVSSATGFCGDYDCKYDALLDALKS